MAVRRSYRHINVSFSTGFDGGFRQTITCQYRTISGEFIDAASRTFVLGFNGTVELAVSEGLQPETVYQIRLVSDNVYTEGSAAVSDILEVSTRGASCYGF